MVLRFLHFFVRNVFSGLVMSNIKKYFLLICIFSSYSVALETGDSPIFFSSSNQVVEQSNCFTEDMSSYDSWINTLINGSRHLDVRRIAKLIPKARFEHHKTTLDCYLFVYDVGGILVKGVVVKPKDKNMTTKKPVIIYNRGGNDHVAHTLNFISLFSYHMPLAERGYIVISTQYRGAKIWPATTELNVGQDEFGGAEIKDVISLYPIIKGIRDANETRIGMFGWSRGGMMTYLALKQSSWIKAAAVGGAPTDLLSLSKDRPEMENFVFKRLIPNYETNKKRELENRSAIYWADKLPKSVPILILHGGADFSVPVQDSSRLADKLKELKHPHKLLIVPGASHGIREKTDLVLLEIINWFDRHL